MRLKETEVTFIIKTFIEVIPSITGSLYLFGSRVDGFKKGGDIDLLFVTLEENLVSYRNLKTKINNAIQDKIGEQKIDITIVSDLQMKEDEFLLSLTNKILLKKFDE